MSTALELYEPHSLKLPYVIVAAQYKEVQLPWEAFSKKIVGVLPSGKRLPAIQINVSNVASVDEIENLVLHDLPISPHIARRLFEGKSPFLAWADKPHVADDLITLTCTDGEVQESAVSFARRYFNCDKTTLPFSCEVVKSVLLASESTKFVPLVEVAECLDYLRPYNPFEFLEFSPGSLTKEVLDKFYQRICPKDLRKLQKRLTRYGAVSEKWRDVFGGLESLPPYGVLIGTPFRRAVHSLGLLDAFPSYDLYFRVVHGDWTPQDLLKDFQEFDQVLPPYVRKMFDEILSRKFEPEVLGHIKRMLAGKIRAPFGATFSLKK